MKVFIDEPRQIGPGLGRFDHGGASLWADTGVRFLDPFHRPRLRLVQPDHIKARMAEFWRAALAIRRDDWQPAYQLSDGGYGSSTSARSPIVCRKGLGTRPALRGVCDAIALDGGRQRP